MSGGATAVSWGRAFMCTYAYGPVAIFGPPPPHLHPLKGGGYFIKRDLVLNFSEYVQATDLLVLFVGCILHYNSAARGEKDSY